MNIAHEGVQTDLDRTSLTDLAVAHGEGVLAENGALVVSTGQRTGRSPRDRFYVQDAETRDRIAWGGVNQPLAPAAFEALWQRVGGWLDGRAHYLGHYHAGAHARHYLPLQVHTETAWHQLFAHNLFIRPPQWNPESSAPWTILNAPGFACDPERDGTHSDGIVAIDLTGRRILIAGIGYAGEMKKAVFSALNYRLPEAGLLPMHCSANQGRDGRTALFFGLSGTGKTTLSADPERLLIGDDEHGWGSDGIFNFEGGCYAKCVDLSPEKEPMIHQAIRRQAVLENVVLTEGGRPDYTDTRWTENTRAAYPLTHIEPRVDSGAGSEPSAVVFLTCDLTGVLPPVARLSQDAAAYHFLSGYTALVGSTELGSEPGIRSTFSMCFGAPFFPRPAQTYADLLRERLAASGAKVYLVNTGWTGGGYGVGRRFSIPETRAVISAIVSGELDRAPTHHLPGLNLDVPMAVPGLAPERLQPRHTWRSGEAYDRAASALIAQFRENMQRFEVSPEIHAAGPEALALA